MTAQTGSFPTYALLPGDRVLLTGGDWHIPEGTEATVIRLETPSQARIKHENPGITFVTNANWPCQLVERDGKRVKSVWKDSRDSLHIEFVDGSQAFTLRHGAWVSTIWDHAVMGCTTLLYEIDPLEADTTEGSSQVTKFKEGDRVTITKGARSLYSVWDGGVGTVTKPHHAPDAPYTVVVDREGTEYKVLFKPEDLTLIPTALTPETATDEQIDEALEKVRVAAGACKPGFYAAVDEAKNMTLLRRLEHVAFVEARTDLYDALVKELTPKPERKVKWSKGATVQYKYGRKNVVYEIRYDVYEGDKHFVPDHRAYDGRKRLVDEYERVEITVVN